MQINEPGPHIDQLLRQTRDHHVQLSAMADMKANMLLTVSMLVITFTAPHILNTEMQVAAFIVCLSSMCTVILAAYAVMPKIRLPGKSAPPVNPKSPGFNLMFFGDFTKLTQDQFEEELEQVLNDPSKVYETKAREIYTMGMFLAHKKYRFIRLAYTVFILGLVISGAALVISIA